MALLEAPVRQLREVPGRRGALEAVAQAQPGVSDPDLRHDVEGSAAGERDRELRERLEAPAEAGRRPSDALRDRLELAELGGDQREDAVRLAQVESGQDDGIGDVAAGNGHESDGSTQTRARLLGQTGLAGEPDGLVDAPGERVAVPRQDEGGGSPSSRASDVRASS